MEAFWYDLGFLVLAGLVAWRTRGDRRAWGWLAAGAASYVVSAAWHRMGGPSPFVMAAACDAAVAFAIYALAKYLWELNLGRIFRIALLVNILNVAYTLHLIPMIEADVWKLLQAGALDLCNLAALSWIWINGARQRVGKADGLPPFRAPLRYLHRVVEALHRERAHHPFWKAR